MIEALAKLRMHPKSLEIYQRFWPVYTGHRLIRIGGEEDGSYVLPNVLDGIQLCLSPGICGVIEFERHLGMTYGIPTIGCDPDLQVIADLPDFIRLDRLALAASTGPGKISFADWLSLHGYTDASPLLLSMDIEGGEYEVIPSLSSEDLARIRIATIEFHYLHLLHQAHSPEARLFADTVESCLSKILLTHDIVHMKPNNNCPFDVVIKNRRYTAYTCIEVTFLNKQLRYCAPQRLPLGRLPHMLDRPNVNSRLQADYSFYSTFA